MCTAVTYKTKYNYFGRTLDYEFLYPSEVTVTPRNYTFEFRNAGSLKTHFAMIGTAYVTEGYPLYYDAVNEKGLGMAGLNFIGNAAYSSMIDGRDNIAQFEFIPWILGQCKTVGEAKQLLNKINLTNSPFSDELTPSELHWIISDRESSITIESVNEGLKIYVNPVGVLTNNPSFPEQIFNLNNYMHLSARAPENRFSKDLDLQIYSRGMGAIGLPGDLSSMSRFIRAAFVKMNSVSGESEAESVSQFFHILGSVDQVRGCCELENEKHEITIYSSCCNVDKGIYYYTSYDNHRITAIDMHKEDLDSGSLIRYPMRKNESIFYEN